MKVRKIIDGRQFVVWKSWHPLILHWLLNPGLAINELILGQRLPKNVLTEQGVGGPLTDRQYVQCPNCQSLTNSMLWNQASAGFGNWFGLVCPHCGEKLPLVSNVLTKLVAILLWPILYPIERRYGPTARAKQRKTLLQALAQPQPSQQDGPKRQGLRMGLMFGSVMAISYSAQSYWGSAESLYVALTTGLIAGSAAGLFFGVAMKFLMFREKKITR